MIGLLKVAQATIEVYLFGGQAFKLGSKFVTQEEMSEDFCDFLMRKRQYKIYDYTSTTYNALSKEQRIDEYYSGDLCYCPMEQAVYLLSTDELKKLQNNMTSEGTQSVKVQLAKQFPKEVDRFYLG